MPKLTILTKDEQRKFDKIPALSREERQCYFRIDKKTKTVLSKLTTATHKVGYVLQLGYFNAFAKFYPSTEFKKRDINYVKRMLGIREKTVIDLSTYSSTSYYRHQQKIRDSLGWQECDDNKKAFLLSEATRQASLQRKPKRIFMHLVDSCWKHQIVIPSFTELAELVTKGFLDFENTMLSRLTTHVDDKTKMALDGIIDCDLNTHSVHPLLQLKQIDQSLKPRNLAKSIQITEEMAKTYHQCSDLLDHLDLSDQAIEYYSTWVQKARSSQLSEMTDRHQAYLYTLAFCQHQYFTRQDALMTAFLKCIAHSLTRVRNQLNQHELDTRQSRNKAIKTVVKNHRSQRELLQDIRLVSEEKNIGPSEKYYKIASLIAEFDVQQLDSDINIGQSLENQLLDMASEDKLYDIMSRLSRRLQLRVGQILNVLEFNDAECEPTLLKAIQHYQKHKGKLSNKAPTEFLTDKEQSFVIDNEGINIPLYKYLLFIHVANGIKSGNLNLRCSYRFKAISEYLISKQAWNENRDHYIRAAGLESYEDSEVVLNDLKISMDQKYHEINKAYRSDTNPHLSLNKDGRIAIKTPKTDYDTSEFNSETLEQLGTVSIQQIMSDIQRVTNFSSAFSHMSIKHSKLKPKFTAITAGLIGLGCNIGINKLANISMGIGESTLRNTVNWCFNKSNLKEANQTIVKAISDLVLAKSYVKNVNRLHSSSDGRKIGVSVDSLLAGRSFKYFGKDQGVVIYTFIDERHTLFHSTVISASEREAPYVIDGLMKNDVEGEIFHSTDEHGFSEAVHGATHLIGTSFAPRFKCIGKKTIYGLSGKAALKKLGYEITPSRLIKKKDIRDNWDDILRFIATIKLNHSTASQLFKRLSSYAKEHPLYKGLKEFGRIIKSLYILTYCNDVDLRQDVQKNLNRIELSNKFSHAIFFDNDQEFRTGLGDEQELAISCKIIIQNAIVLWNYLALSEMIVNTADREHKKELVDSIHRCSMLCWRHINFRGTYDFRKKAVQETYFNMDEIRQMKID